MNCIVQLRGCNACGKSTAMKQYAFENGLREKLLNIHGEKQWVMVNGTTAVIGKYQQQSNHGGLDQYKGKQHFYNTLCTLMSGGYKTICFESYMLSKTQRFCEELNAFAKKNGWEYIAVLMDIGYTTELSRLFERNGGAEIDMDKFDQGRMKIYRVQNNLRKKGIKTMTADVENTPYQKMGGIRRNQLIPNGLRRL